MTFQVKLSGLWISLGKFNLKSAKIAGTTGNFAQKSVMLSENHKTCFVCMTSIVNAKFTMNGNVMLPVCTKCKGSDEERKRETELLDSLGEGQFCGCI